MELAVHLCSLLRCLLHSTTSRWHAIAKWACTRWRNFCQNGVVYPCLFETRSSCFIFAPWRLARSTPAVPLFLWKWRDVVQRPLVFSLRVQMDLGAGFGVSEWAGCWPGLPLHAHRDLGVGLEKFGNCAGLQVDVGEFLDCLLFAHTSPGVQWCGCGSLLHVGGVSVTRGGGRLAEVRVDACGVLFSCSRSILCTCICTCMYAAWAWASRGGGRVAEVRVGVLVVLLGSALALFISFIFCYTYAPLDVGRAGALRGRESRCKYKHRNLRYGGDLLTKTPPWLS